MRLERDLENNGFITLVVVDHGANAASTGLELRPRRLVIFGNKQAATPPMWAAPTIAIELPQKMLI